MVSVFIDDEALDLSRLIRPVRRRLALNSAVRWILRGAAIACGGNALVLLLRHTVVWPEQDPLGGAAHWMAAIAIIALASSMAAVWATRPTTYESIRVADRALELKDRLTTALEYAHDQSSIMRLQRSELQNALRGKTMSRAVSLAVPRREILITVVALLLAVSAALTPNQLAAPAAAQKREHAIAQYAATQVRQLIATRQVSPSPQVIASRKSSTAPRSQDHIEPLLRQLAANLSAARDTRAALKLLSTAQNQVRQTAIQASSDQAALRALAAPLAGGSTAALSSALSAGDDRSTQQSFQNLQSSLGAMNPRQRADLAHSLERAANAAPTAMKQTFRRAAFALGNVDSNTARQALKDLASQIAHMQANAAALPSLDNAAQKLTAIQHDVANNVVKREPMGVSAATSPRTTGKPATQSASVARTTTSGQRHGNTNSAQASGPAASNGSNSNHSAAAAANSATGTESSNVVAAASSGTTTSGNGRGKGGSSSGHGSGTLGSAGPGVGGHLQTVFLPGKRGTGPGITENGPLGATIATTSPAFRRVVAQFVDKANLALGRVALPARLQGAVKQYFAALQHK